MRLRIALIESRSEKGKVMSNWHDIKGDNPAPHGRLLLLLTQPQTYDGAEPDIYDILVGYWHKKTMEFVPAFNPTTGRSS
jgi:hypothetical protein